MTRRRTDYTTIKLPTDMLKHIQDYVNSHLEYTSQIDFIKEALRFYLSMKEKGNNRK